MKYVQYYHRGVKTGRIIPACGDRAVVVLDGRNSLASMQQDAIFIARQRGYTAYQILEDDTLARGVRTLTGIMIIDG
jgi:hypothetical protein